MICQLSHKYIIIFLPLVGVIYSYVRAYIHFKVDAHFPGHTPQVSGLSQTISWLLLVVKC